MDLSNSYHRAALMFFLSATLHVVVIVLSGATYLASMVSGLLICIVLALGLMRQWRWLAYFAFLAALVGAIVAFGNGMAEFGLVQTAFFGIALADLAAALILFGLLWRSAPKVET